MLTPCNPFDSAAILHGIRRWSVDGKGAHIRYVMYISSIEPRARLLYRLYQRLR
jgi:hypothetical protein